MYEAFVALCRNALIKVVACTNLLVLLIGTIDVCSAEDIPIRKIFGPESPGPYKHPAAITELENGDLYLAYYGGEGEYAQDTAVYGSRLEKGADEWTPPVVIADTPGRSEGNPVVWQAPDDVVWLFYVCRYGDTWSTSRIKAKLSRDGARSWSDSVLLTLQEGTMVRNQPIVLDDGDYLLPIYYETGADTEFTAADTCSMFLRYRQSEELWSPAGRILSKNGNLQPAVVQLPDGKLVAYCRRAGGYGEGTEGYIVRSESTDGGETWSEGRDTEFPNPNAAVEMLRLQEGPILLIYNDSMTDRTPLSAALSVDGELSWSHRRDLLTGEGPYAYPYAIQGRDRRIHLIYTSNDRTGIYHAVATLAELFPEAASAADVR